MNKLTITHSLPSARPDPNIIGYRGRSTGSVVLKASDGVFLRFWLVKGEIEIFHATDAGLCRANGWDPIFEGDLDMSIKG